MLDAAGLESPLACGGRAHFVSDQDTDRAGLHAHPHVVAVHVIRDQDPGREGFADHGQHPVGVLRAHLHLDLERTRQQRGWLGNNRIS